jgi:Fic/DOC family
MRQDALTQHCKATQLIDWVFPSPELADRLRVLRTSFCLNDAHLHYIDQFDAHRSEERAEHMRSAVELVRKNAMNGDEFTFNLLQNWQRTVLGTEDADFRQGPAFAKGGLEIYRFDETTENMFAEKISRDSKDEAHALCKAIRTYLDICFFHPFENGNSRAARLAFEFFLTKDGFTVSDVRPLFALPRVAGRKNDYLDFLDLAVYLCEKSIQG